MNDDPPQNESENHTDAGNHADEQRPPREPEWSRLGDLFADAFREGCQAGTNQAHRGAGKFKEMTEKGIYDATYSLAYALAYGASMAKDAFVDPMKEGAKAGASAGQQAAQDARERDTAPEDLVPESS